MAFALQKRAVFLGSFAWRISREIGLRGEKMLKLPQKHTGDKKADAIIAQYLNKNILGLVQDKILDYEKEWGKEAREDDPVFCEAVSMFFPDGYPPERMGKVFLGLQALLESEYEFVPELAAEYVMHSLILERVETADRLGIPTLEPISASRDYVINALRETYPDEPETSDEGDIIISWHEKLEELEDLHYYEDIYFWDIDFLLLDSYTEPQLLENPASGYLGIENIEDPARKFTLPPEWLK